MNKRFVVGIDRAKMRLYDCEQSAQEDLHDNDNVNQDIEMKWKKDIEEKVKKNFEGFKFN